MTEPLSAYRGGSHTPDPLPAGWAHCDRVLQFVALVFSLFVRPSATVPELGRGTLAEASR